MEKLNNSGGSWNRKRIILVASVLLALITIAFYTKTFSLDKYKGLITRGKVKGASTNSDSISFPTSDDLKSSAQEKLEQLQKEVQQINVIEIASSSPQVQKVINDFKSLEDYPKDQVKTFCQNICNGL